MVCKGPEKPDYDCKGWVDLRNEILDRDGHCCRNCGAAEGLEVHHWLPLPEHRHEVNEWGYKDAECPLIVPKSGLITICDCCHAALTRGRKEKARNVEHIRKLRARRKPVQNDLSLWVSKINPEPPHNIFELWGLNNQSLPFKVIRETWYAKADQFFLVEEIEIRKVPYGFAWGRYCRDGEFKEREKIKGAGSYQWLMKE